jgi:SulP family sulfate permease
VGITEIFVGISLVSLIFQGPLEVNFPLGAGLVLVTTAILFAVVSIFGTWVGAFPVVQDVTTVLMAVIISALAGSVTRDQLLPTTLAALAACTLLAGAALVGVGVLNLGKLIRYLPYPVLGGFLAATGFLLITGSLSSLTGIELRLSNLELYLQKELVILWLPAMVIGFIAFLVIRKVTNPFAFPGLVLGTVAVFYLVFALLGISSSQASTIGYLYKVETAISWQPFNPAMLSLVNWKAILSQAGNIAALLGMTMIGLLLNLSALEADKGEEFGLNRELTITGIANILVGLAGGLIGYHAVATTRLGMRLGANTRITGITISLLCLLTMWVGPTILGIIPRPLISGMLLFLGFDFLYDWVITGWLRFSRYEYLIVLLIMGVIIATDFLTGVIVGLIAMVVLFSINYSQIKVYRFSTSGTTTRSIVKRSTNQRLALDSHGEQIHVLELQGYLFFGTANTLLELVKQRIQKPELEPLRYLVLDFRMVTGIDTSAALAFYKVEKITRVGGITIILTNITKELLARLRKGGFNASSQDIKQFEDLDRGLEWCEDSLLYSLGEDTVYGLLSVEELLEADGITHTEARRLLTYFKNRAFEKGSCLWQKGDLADFLFFIVHGRVSVYWENANGNSTRLNTLGPGTSVGEMGLYLGAQRSAVVIADEPTEGLVLTREALDCMEKDDPQLASVFHILISRQLAAWVLQGDQMLEELRKSS